ncbi:hypothetical protein EXW72_07230 [Pseudomonas sp. BCA14]|uniref:hypothetical protein n=1 Tax=unclassified Pseudomonas TaxID=196821 RepID=UPI00106E3F1E|nr:MULTISPECIES: hypothetical protein [unclassified Pseudomonas]TFF13932.1 hypothetical protein EXW70_05260 [Pseudomonas sp. JMN1]TFF15385.1 hypothetical protein EXW71_03780 [Pseudomonas sp. BCA17]TFF31792.1 hypothetical protein EXW72_07230 [Pseudomonas sp. BCA14]TFF32744.1 hypothetical protein EXW73_03030 [Pseudomonas sp. BCA13]
MDTSTSQVRNPARPVMVTLAVIYCLAIAVKIAYWLVSEGWGMARVGDFPLIMLFPPALACVLLVAGGVLFWGRRAKSSWFLLSSLFFALTLIPLTLPEIFRVPASQYVQVVRFVLPEIIQAVLLIAVWVYSLWMRRTGYFK